MVANFKISSFHKKTSFGFWIAPASSAFVRTKARTRTALQICRACFACWDAIPIPVNITSRDSRALLRSAERAFCRNAKPASHDAEQQVWAVPNKLLQGKGLCIYKDIACKRASAYQNGTTKHCLQKLLHPSELSIPLAAVILDSSKIFQEAVAVTAKQVQIGDRSCRTYGADCAEYLLLQMTDEHELQRMDNEVAAIAQGAAHPFLFAAVPVESWNDALSPWEAPAVWGKQGFGGKAGNTLRFLTEQVIPSLKQQLNLPENVKIILGGYSLAGLFALWASTQTDLFYGIAAASPSVWFPGWMEFEQQYPMQTQRVYLSLGDKEECTKNTVMAVVGNNIRTLHSQLTARGTDCTLQWNSGGHFKDADLRTAKAFRWAMEENR